MPNLTKADAEKIAKKLRAETVAGRRHDIVKVVVEGQWIGQFGIRRGGANQLHNYVAEQLHLTRKQALDLAKCPLSFDQYVEILRDRGVTE